MNDIFIEPIFIEPLLKIRMLNFKESRTGEDSFERSRQGERTFHWATFGRGFGDVDSNLRDQTAQGYNSQADKRLWSQNSCVDSNWSEDEEWDQEFDQKRWMSFQRSGRAIWRDQRSTRNR